MAVKIFFCYAHEDEEFLNKLKTHLRPLQRQGLIDVWHDRDISAGTEWEEEIGGQLNTAQIILLLVSPDFMNSDYCYGIEMNLAIERHKRKEARVIPIILRPVYWKGAPFSNLQTLPKYGKPVTSWSNQDEAFNDLANQIIEVVKELNINSSTDLTAKSVEVPQPGEETFKINQWLETNDKNIRVGLSFPVHKTTVKQTPISAIGRVEGLSRDTKCYIVAYVITNAEYEQGGADIGKDGYWKIDAIHLGAMTHRLFFRILDQDSNMIAKSKEIIIFKH